MSSLTIVAEVGAALAGFATLAGVLRRGHRDRVVAFGVVETSLIALVFALLPRVIVSLRVAALLFFIVLATALFTRIRQNMRVTEKSLFDTSELHPLLIGASFVPPIAGLVFALLVVLPIWPKYDEWFYESAVLCPLLMSCFMLWLTVRNLVLNDDDPAA
jgi:H+/Cl- antiporter ClcA